MHSHWSEKSVAKPRDIGRDIPSSKVAPSARLPHPATVSHEINWVYFVPLVVVHLLALLAILPQYFSVSGCWLLLAGTYFYGGIGIDLCYHRLLTHRSFKLPRWLERCCIIGKKKDVYD